MLKEVNERIENLHIRCFKDGMNPLLMISSQYPGLWLEHVYDSVFYAQMDASKLYLAQNAINLFIDNQSPEGQLPFAVMDGGYVGYSQVQECVSFASLCYKVYELNGDKLFLEKAFNACVLWVCFIRNHRMTLKSGLVEMFVGFDTGHDNSPRLEGMSHKGNFSVDGVRMNAKIMPPNDNVAPIIAVDMSCNLFGNLMALAKMAKELGKNPKPFVDDAMHLKERLFKICYDENDGFFYDVDKHGNKRRVRSCAVFSLFIEGVLDKEADKAIIDRLFNEYIFNEKHFYTEMPFPAVSVSDEKWQKYTASNCWGYFTQGLTVLRTTLWMREYGKENEMNAILKKWADAWDKCKDKVVLGQELDPLTAQPSDSSPWYSSTMLTYKYAKEILQ